MNTILKRKSIDLPIDTLDKLSSMALMQGKSLKTFMEGLLISKANSSTTSHTNPSPSGDKWFDDAENMKSIEEGIHEYIAGKGKEYSIDDIKKIIGV